jgi:hypothetical protein
MAEYGEWTRKGAVLSEGTAQNEYGVSREFILRGIQSGHLEVREGSGWGNPYFKILRSQIEAYIASELGTEYLSVKKCQSELRATNKKITELKRTLAALEARKVELMELACKQSVTKQRKGSSGAVV